MAIKIAFIGRRHVGKSTATEIVTELHNKDVCYNEAGEACKLYQLAFAEPLKNAFVEAFKAFQVAVGEEPDFTRQELNENKNYYRRQLEDFGTKFVRDRYREDFWVELMRKNLSEISSHPHPVTIVVDDCRFLNEAALLKSRGFTLVRLVRNERERGISILESQGWGMSSEFAIREPQINAVLAEEMPSEKEVDDIQCDYMITNTGDYAELKLDIEVIINRIGHGS